MVEVFQKWQELISSCFTSDKIMYASSIPAKPKRKTLEVPIHQQHQDEHATTKTIQHISARKYKHRSSDRSPHRLIQYDNEKIDDSEKFSRISKKQLWKENVRLAKEKEEVIAKFNELEELSVKKITKMREKVSGLQNEKAEFENEIYDLKNRLHALFQEYEGVKNQLEICKVCRGCEEYKVALETYSFENSSLKKSKEELNEDLNMLKTVVFRLNVQLERYQEKLRKFNISDVIGKNVNYCQITEIMGVEQTIPHDVTQEGHAVHQHYPISWGKVNSHTLGPLLEAFQDTINEKDNVINEYETELANFTAKFKEIISENEKLHIRLTEDDECSVKLRDDLNQLRKELQNCKDQNDGLIKKCSLKQDKIEEILKCYETKVDQLKRDYKVLHDEYYKSRSEVASLGEKNKILIQQFEEQKQEKKEFIPISVHTSSVNECKKWYEELKTQYEKEKEKLKLNVERLEREITELKSKLNVSDQERHDREDKIKQLEKQLRKGEAKYLELEQNLNESQVTKTACKKQLHKAMNFAKDLVAEQETLLRALSQRQQENKVVTKYGVDMASKMDNLKSQLKEVQRDALHELNTVEGKIQEQEQTIEQMKDEYEKEIERLEQIIRRQSDKAVVLKNENKLPISPYSLFRDKLQN